jgi:hypothetical protein
MMVVVPTLTKQHDAEERVVRGMIRRRIAPGSEPVAHEVHGRRAVDPEKAPRQAIGGGEESPAPEKPHERDRRHAGDKGPPVQPEELGIGSQIRRDGDEVLLAVAIAQQVTDPGRPQAVPRAHQVPLGVGPAMVLPVTAGKPDRIGEAHGREESEEELERAARPERAMGEVAMESAPERERDEEVTEAKADPVAPGRWAPQQGEGRHVEQSDGEPAKAPHAEATRSKLL